MVFPEAKLKKLFSTGGKASFRKADFALGLKRLLDDCLFSYKQDITFIYPFGKNTDSFFSPYIYITRMTMMRQGSYYYNGFWGYNKSTGKSMFYRSKNKVHSYEETEAVMLGMVKAIKEVQQLVIKMKLDPKQDSEEISDLFDKSFDAFVPKSY